MYEVAVTLDLHLGNSWSLGGLNERRGGWDKNKKYHGLISVLTINTSYYFHLLWSVWCFKPLTFPSGSDLQLSRNCKQTFTNWRRNWTEQESPSWTTGPTPWGFSSLGLRTILFSRRWRYGSVESAAHMLTCSSAVFGHFNQSVEIDLKIWIQLKIKRILPGCWFDSRYRDLAIAVSLIVGLHMWPCDGLLNCQPSPDGCWDWLYYSPSHLPPPTPRTHTHDLEKECVKRRKHKTPHWRTLYIYIVRNTISLNQL